MFASLAWWDVSLRRRGVWHSRVGGAIDFVIAIDDFVGYQLLEGSVLADLISSTGDDDSWLRFGQGRVALRANVYWNDV
jgi:hypothetical protein